MVAPARRPAHFKLFSAGYFQRCKANSFPAHPNKVIPCARNFHIRVKRNELSKRHFVLEVSAASEYTPYGVCAAGAGAAFGAVPSMLVGAGVPAHGCAGLLTVGVGRLKFGWPGLSILKAFFAVILFFLRFKILLLLL